MPHTMLISVVLPAPFGPSSPKISPRRISRFVRFNASNPDAYVFVKSLIEMIGCMRRLGKRSAHDMDRGRADKRFVAGAPLERCAAREHDRRRSHGAAM